MEIKAEVVTRESIQDWPEDLREFEAYLSDEEGVQDIAFVGRNGDEIEAAAYAWNLDSLKDAEFATRVEVFVLLAENDEARAELVDWLDEAYVLSIYDVYNEWYDERGFIFPADGLVESVGWSWTTLKNANPEHLISWLTEQSHLDEPLQGYFGKYRQFLWNAIPSIRAELPDELLLERFQ